MRYTRDSPSATDRIEAALEASCAALVTLESLSFGAGEPSGRQERVVTAIRSLRHAIEQLRWAQSDHADELALGFVLNGRPRPGRRQSRPRRTA